MPRGSLAEQLRSAVAGSELDSPEKDESPAYDVEPDEDQDASIDENQELTEESEDEQYIEYFNDLPEAYGIDQDDFFGLKLKLQTGEEIPFGEIKDRLQSIDSERQQIAQQREALEAQAKQAQQTAMQGMQMSQRGMVALGELAAIQRKLPDIEQTLAEMEKDDPGKAALERQKLQQQISGLQMEMQAGQQEQQQQFAQWTAYQNQILMRDPLGNLPEWKKDDSRKKLQNSLAQFAIERYGVTADQLGKIDAMTLLMLKDARDGVTAKDKAKAAVRKVRKAPKTTVKGVRMGRGVKKQRVAELENRARSSHRRQDITAAMRGILGEIQNGN